MDQILFELVFLLLLFVTLKCKKVPILGGRSGPAHFSTGTSNGIYCSRDQCVIYGAIFDKHFQTNAYTTKSVPLQVVWTRASFQCAG